MAQTATENRSLPKSNRQATTEVSPLNPIQKPYLLAGVAATIILFIATVAVAGWVQGLLFVIGLGLGLALLYARFGFTSAFRRLLSVGNVQGLQAHMVMLAVATTLFAIIFATNFSFTGVDPTGYVSPVGISVVFGSFLFGMGMQMGSGCASGTLYSVGGGKSSMVLTLLGFIAGSVIGAYHFIFWTQETPSLPPISLAESTGFGYFGGWIFQLLIFLGIYGLTVKYAQKKNPPQMKPLPTTTGLKRLWRGSWPLLMAAVVLAGLNALTLTVRGNPWGITSAFALWGSKVLMAFGIDVSSWGYWQGNTEALQTTVLADSTSVMNFGIILGAFMAAAAQGNFKPGKIKPGIAASSIIGGLMMGYGARLAFGCNIGAYFGGIASFSLHGWVWMIMALAGSYLALFIRPLFGLKNPNPKDSMC
ncbi:YeeE/YedE family protein [Thalassobacillus pellis]|uniref:YeeE/YedE family protein n=1 Tax=Thalassobacillus pellis TaxID=748008 RepID=UPI00195FF20B|nr:YeeE/YedE family protein [Thalassobacillus pellis]MBM7553093.1 putative membrane protein YedE/YeeE [Thalassobacillus pellis]